MAAELEARRRLLDRIGQYPGLHLRELAREAGMSEQLAAYHTDRLEAEGLVRSHPESGFRRFYPMRRPEPSEEERKLLEMLRRPVPLQVALHLLRAGSASHKQIAASVGLAKSTVSYHLSRMEAEGVVRRRDGRIRLRRPRQVERVLLQWRPPPSLTSRFAELWTAFYRARR